jgi:hypothetical protein
MNRIYYVNIDGRWAPVVVASGWGGLGEKLLCKLGGANQKELLLRFADWPQQGDPVPIGIQGDVKYDKKKNYIPPLRQSYYVAVKQADGKSQTYPRPVQFLQQDVSGLRPLEEAIRQVARENRSDQIGKVFFNACQALDEYCREAVAAGSDKIALQMPGSLAVGSNGKVVLLDAGLSVPVPHAAKIKQEYVRWFGQEYANGWSESKDAFMLHLNALLRYFMNVLQDCGKSGTEVGRLLAGLSQLTQAKNHIDLEEIERHVPEEWTLPLPDDDKESETHGERRPSRVPLSISVLFNILLLAILLVLWFLGRGGIVAGGIETSEGAIIAPSKGTAVLSTYGTVFPIEGTLHEKVLEKLRQLFPGKVEEVGSDHEKLLATKISALLNKIPKEDREYLKDIFKKLLEGKARVRFRGYVDGEPEESLRNITAQGGIFSYYHADEQRYESLLQPSGLEVLSQIGGFSGDKTAQRVFKTFREIVVEYASYRDALGIIGRRTAFLVHLDPTPEAHENARKKLGLLERPLFVARPLPLLFDAIDPSADIGGGTSSYVLKLDRPCYWRLVCKRDRSNYDLSRAADQSRFQWKKYSAGTPIVWKAISLRQRQGLLSSQVATFDIAVIVDKQVVVFYNQSILTSDKLADIKDQARDFVARGLGIDLTNSSLEEVLSYRQQGDQFVGALRYSFLADKVLERHPESQDIMILSERDFSSEISTGRERKEKERLVPPPPLVPPAPPPPGFPRH